MSAVFWALAAALVALAVVLLLRPLLRRRGDERTAPRGAYDVAVYRDQLAEIGRDRQRGLLTDTEAAEAEREVKRRLLAAAEQAERQASPAAKRSWALPLAIVVLAPAASVGLYLSLGSPGMPGVPIAERAQEITRAETMQSSVAQLAARLAADPSDARGWALLGRGYMALERYGDAANAFRQARERGLDGAETNAALGEALIAANGGAVSAAAKEAFAAALAAEPREPRARYYLGLAAYQEGRGEEALETWLALLRDSRADAPWVPLLRQNLTGLAAELGRPEGSLDLSTASSGSAPPIGPVAEGGPTAEQVEAVRNMSEEDRQAMIEGMVTQLAARMEEEPENLDGWLRLARSYLVLGREEAALGALRRAKPLVEELPAEDQRRRFVEDGIARLEHADTR